MNKQEAIEKLKSRVKSHWLDEEIYGDSCIKSVELCMAIEIVNQIDEPEKPVVPQFVAEWYEKNKDDLAWSLYSLCVDFYKRELQDDLHNWFKYDDNKPIETLVKMKLYGYEVEKEKLYTVELPSPNCPTDDHYILSRLKNGKIIVNRYCIEQWGKFGDCQLTEAEIKKEFSWAWQFAKEVEND